MLSENIKTLFLCFAEVHLIIVLVINQINAQILVL